MGILEIIGFAACWMLVASLMLWGVLTEKKRGAMKLELPAGAAGPVPNRSRSARLNPGDWVVVETAPGTTDEVGHQARFLAEAWLASHGIDPASVAPTDLRTEVIEGSAETQGTTRVLVRAGALQPSRRNR
jgi:hypothetical protein